MINYHFKTWEFDGCWTADIYANSDYLKTIVEFSTEKEAELAAQAFIDGIKFARGEE